MDTLESINKALKLGNEFKSELIKNNENYLKQFNENNREKEYQDYTNEKLENNIEDIQLAELYGEEVIRIENGQNETYEVDSISDAFKMINK